MLNLNITRVFIFEAYTLFHSGIRTCRGASLRKAEEQVYVNSSAVKTGNSKTREELKLECIEMKIKDESTTDPNEEYELICYNEEETVTKL